MKQPIVIISALLLLLLTPTVSAQDNVIDEIVWIVGDEAILKSQVEQQRINMQYERQQIKGDPYCVIPEQIAIQKLFLHQAKLDSISVNEQQVISEVEMRLNYFISEIGSREKLEEYFRKPYSQIREDMKDVVRDENIIRQMKQKLVSDIKLTPSQVRSYFHTISPDSVPFIPQQVEVQIIQLAPLVPQAEIDEVKDRLRTYSEQINSGEKEFSTLALLYSEDKGSALRGGELGFKGKGEFVKEFSEVAFTLKDPKRVSKVVESEFGFHIIQLIEKRSDRINCRHILIRPEIPPKAVDDAILRLDSIKEQLIDQKKLSFENAALYFSTDKDTRNSKGVMTNPKTGNTRFELQDLPQDIASRVATLNVGEVSKPFKMVTSQMKEVVCIVKLRARIDGHKANTIDDYQALKAILENKKQEEIIFNWIKRKQKDTYIFIKDGYQNCEFEYPGWIKKIAE